MASLIHTLKDNYNDWTTGRSAEVDSWPLMHDPGMVAAIVGVYLLYVLQIGPSYMKNREPMTLRKTMVLYNGLQVLYSIFIVVKSLQVKIPLDAVVSCSNKPIYEDPSNRRALAVAAWWYCMAKITELLDTVFFVLRKRSNQITFLHVYHHSITFIFSWCYLKYAPGEQGALIGLLNSTVHVVMYTYYFLAALGPAYKKYLWWKKYMTVMQLAQFVIMIAYMSMLTFSNCGFQRSVTYFFLTNSLVFLYLFAKFYRNTYSKKSKSLRNGPLTSPVNTNGSGNHTANGLSNGKYVNGEQAYSRITKDVLLLNKGEKLNKVE